VVGRDIRMAKTAPEVEKLVGQLQQIAADGRARLSTLEAQSTNPASRERFKSIGELFAQYVAALEACGAKQTEILVLFGKLDQVESKWVRGVNLVVNSVAFTNLPNYKEIEAFINEAASLFKDARTATWRYFLLNEASQVRRISASSEQAVQQLNYAATAAIDKTVIAGIDTLRSIVPEYTTALKAITDAIDAQNLIQSERANPADEGSRKLLGEAINDANAASDAATAQAAAAVARAGRVRLVIGVVVGLVLLGTAAFASLAIGRALRRIGEVLMELAGGNKTVLIPYAERRDEVGDTARAATAFKENLLRVDRLEAEQKAAAERTVVERKSTMHLLAEEFERAVGSIVGTVSSASGRLEEAANNLTRAADKAEELSSEVAAGTDEGSSSGLSWG